MDETERVQRKLRMERTAEGAVSRRVMMGVMVRVPVRVLVL